MRTRACSTRSRTRAKETIYATTGIQFIAINTLYQLMSLVESADPDLGRADRLLLMADLINYFLCDRAVAEYTNATTTQCLDVTTRTWASELLSTLGIPTRIFPGGGRARQRRSADCAATFRRQPHDHCPGHARHCVRCRRHSPVA